MNDWRDVRWGNAIIRSRAIRSVVLLLLAWSGTFTHCLLHEWAAIAGHGQTVETCGSREAGTVRLDDGAAENGSGVPSAHLGCPMCPGSHVALVPDSQQPATTIVWTIVPRTSDRRALPVLPPRAPPQQPRAPPIA